MFTLLEDYDVQATRREAWEEAREEAKIENVVNIIKELHISLSKAMSIIELQENSRARLVEELMRRGVAYTE